MPHVVVIGAGVFGVWTDSGRYAEPKAGQKRVST
jgi:hypothetical protein